MKNKVSIPRKRMRDWRCQPTSANQSDQISTTLAIFQINIRITILVVNEGNSHVVPGVELEKGFARCAIEIHTQVNIGHQGFFMSGWIKDFSYRCYIRGEINGV